MKSRTTAKTIRIPNDIYADIEREAAKKDTSFSKEAIDRLRHVDNSLTPDILATIQTIINKSLEGVKTGSCKPIKEAQEEANKLWKNKLSK
ncbi:hypothetical protein SAMN02910265_00998 [Ruminococcus flavefaciens]|jgi:hypothetical protein|uniref:Uncharacterized protein n=1 Tax=Ruminococcus flavefaciens TaxID=1265 RepID=A0A1H6IJ54_RUMFL|nr:hypothetical protein [Ruminococcus flavefaciens]SEH48612.1 hypothetical protein SAMN02910265_00998 [Ruminococcus flavefaciens]